MATSPGPSRSRLVSTYFDTPDLALARRGASLRVRRRGRRFVQTVKTAGRADIAAFGRGEWEDVVADNAPDPHAAESGPHLPPETVERLRPVFRTEVTRVTIPLAPSPETRIEAAVDRGRIRNGADIPPAAISEIELELKSGRATALYDVALKLLDVAPLRLERRSKAERGYALAAGEALAARASSADFPALDRALTGEAVLQLVGRACLDHLLRNEPGALAGDAEAIHQMRVAMRRLRAILSAFSPLLPKAARREASDRLRWVGDVLGEVRNLDVFVADLLNTARADLPEASEFERLAVAARRRRDAVQARAAEAIRSTRYTAAVLALLRWFDGAEWRGPECPQALQDPIGELAGRLLERHRGRVRRRARHFRRQTAGKRHELRIALKKLRYAAELFADLYDRPAARQFIQRLKRLQDDLGAMNDVWVGHDIVEALSNDGIRDVGVAHAGRRILTWHRRRLAAHEPEVRQHVKELLHAERFWPAPA